MHVEEAKTPPATKHAFGTKLKLGKGAVFVKSQLRSLLQSDDVWEADFRPIPVRHQKWSFPGDRWLGMVVSESRALILADEILTAAPSVNDLAKLLGTAMRDPFGAPPHRPDQIRFRTNAGWIELFPHLAQLGIEVVTEDVLPKWHDASLAFLGQRGFMDSKDAGSGETWADNLDKAFPSLAKWARTKVHVELGIEEADGFVIRIKDDRGSICETYRCATLRAAMELLEIFTKRPAGGDSCAFDSGLPD
jgi:hypothetical protein